MTREVAAHYYLLHSICICVSALWHFSEAFINIYLIFYDCFYFSGSDPFRQERHLV